MTASTSENTQITTLDNGLRVVTESVPYVRSASVGLFIGVGSRDEEEPISGISHFIEHMLFKGTARRTAHQIADEIESRGGHLNAWTDKEMTTYQARVLADDTALAIDIMGDMLLHSVFDNEEIVREKSVVLEEIKMYEDSPEDKVHEVFEETMWRSNPLGRAVIGTEQTVSALSREDVTAYVSHRYVPDKIIVAAAGNLNHDEVVKWVAGSIGEIAGKSPGAHHKTPTPSGKSKQLRKRDTEQVNFCLGSHGYSKQAPERFAASILNNVLGGNMSSRLFQEIREKRGLAYSIGSYTRSYRDTGTFCVYGGTGPTTYDQVIELTRSEMQLVKRHGFSADELTKAKTQVRGALVLGLESMSARMNRYGESLISHGRIIPIQEVLDKYDAVTNDAIHAVADYVFNDDLMTLTAIGPFPRASRQAV